MSEIKIKKSDTFEKFGQIFQLQLLNLLINENFAYTKLGGIIKFDYFDNQYTQWIAKELITYLEKYRQVPGYQGYEIIRSKIDDVFKGIKAEPYKKILEEIIAIDLSNRQYVIDEAEIFCNRKHIKQHLEKALQFVELGDFVSAQNMTYNGFKFSNADAEDLVLKKDYKQIFNVLESHRPVPSIFPSFNTVSKGGPGKGHLVLVIAPSNFGKTACAAAQAKEAARQGKKVAFFSLEQRSIETLYRVVSNLVELPQTDLRDHELLIANEVEKLSGDIWLCKFKSTRATTDAFKSRIDFMKSQGFIPDIIIIDSLNNIKLTKTTIYENDLKNDNDKYEYICELLRDWGLDEGVPIWVTFQTNRSGFNSELNDETTIGKAIEPFQQADWVIIFAQSIAMQEKQECHVTLIKNRLGPKGMTLLCHYDTSIGQFTEKSNVNRTLLYDKTAQQQMKKGIKSLESILKKDN